MEIKSIKTWLGFGFTCVGNAVISLFPDNFNWLGWPMLLLGIVMLIIAFQEWIFNRLEWSFLKSWSFPSILPFKILIPLKLAMNEVYHANRETDKADFLELLDGNNLSLSHDMRFEHLATRFKNHAPIYGRYKDISTKIEQIQWKDWMSISPDCNKILYNNNLEYRDLKVDRRDVKRFIRSLQKGNGLDEPW